MRMVALLLGLACIAALIAGVIYVPDHDGRGIDLIILVLIPAVVLCWCIARILPHPKGDD